MGVDCGTDVQITGSEVVGVFASSRWAERAFCTQCGTHLFYRFTASQIHEVSVGLFANAAVFEMGTQIFIDKTPAYYTFANDTPCLTQAQVLAKFAAQ